MNTNDKPTLVVLAAGLGTRFGGVKQMATVGPGGETLLDYSVFDAIRAGFENVVFVIRAEFESVFRDQVGRKFEAAANVSYALQSNQATPMSRANRTKPWGTGHAVLAAAPAIDSPFVVVNADDYYGPSAYQLARDHFASYSAERSAQSLLVGYGLGQTLSPHGSVSRGVCAVDANGMLQSVTEFTDIRMQDSEIHAHQCDGSHGRVLSPNTLVSLNFWGFPAEFLRMLQERFEEFLDVSTNDATAEFFLPSAVDELISLGSLEVATKQSRDSWFGMTYAEDQAYAERAIRDLIKQGLYPSELSFR